VFSKCALQTERKNYLFYFFVLQIGAVSQLNVKRLYFDDKQADKIMG